MGIPKKAKVGQGLPKPKPRQNTKNKNGKQTTRIPEGSRKDRKTGIVYKSIPKTTIDDDGIPKLNDPSFDAQNMNNEAQKYLPHLRVPPDKEEQKRLRAKREAEALKREREYAEMNQTNDENNSES